MTSSKDQQPELSRQPQESDGQKIVAKIIRMSAGKITDIGIDMDKNMFAVLPSGAVEYFFFKLDESPAEVIETKALVSTGGKSVMLRDLQPSDCDRVVLESLAGCFCGQFSRGVLLIPEARSLAELAIKLDMKDDLFVTHADLASMKTMPNWAREGEDA